MARRDYDRLAERLTAAEARVRELEAALAATEAERDTYATALANADDSKARVRELEAHLVASDGARTRAEQQLAAANALLERVKAWDERQERREVGEAFVNIMVDIDNHIEMGRADMAHYHVCPDVKTCHDRAVLEACANWKVRKTEPTSTGQWSLIYGDVQPIAEAELARRMEASRG